MKDAILIELAEVWELQAAMDKDPTTEASRVVLRSCADTLRRIVDAAKAAPVCKERWGTWTGNWYCELGCRTRHACQVRQAHGC